MLKLIFILILVRPAMDILVGFNLFNIGNININFGELWGGLYIISSIIFIISKRNFFKGNNYNIIFLFFFLSILINLVFFTEDLSLGISKFLKWTVWILSFYIIDYIFKNRRFFIKYEKYIDKLSFFLIFFYVVSFILFKFFNINFQKYGFEVYAYSGKQLGFKGIFYGTHSLSFLSLFVLFQLIIKKGVKQNYNYKEIIKIVLLILIIISALTRTGILALLFFIMVIIRKNKALFVISIISIIIFYFYEFNERLIQDRFLKDYYAYQYKTKNPNALGSGRIGMWVSIIKYFNENHFFYKMVGSGLDADFRATKKYFLARGSHNDFLELLLNNGMLILLIYCIFLYKIFKEFFNNIKIKKFKNYNNVLNGMFLSMLILMFFQGLTMSIFMFYFILIIIYIKNKNNYLLQNEKTNNFYR